ncbi:MAG: hypothetical protein Q7S65_05165 [Nanoarchaeota archaeon]|nr:hypothetical protein [Nanoarchaeota archaeon]
MSHAIKKVQIISNNAARPSGFPSPDSFVMLGMVINATMLDHEVNLFMTAEQFCELAGPIGVFVEAKTSDREYVQRFLARGVGAGTIREVMEKIRWK